MSDPFGDLVRSPRFTAEGAPSTVDGGRSPVDGPPAAVDDQSSAPAKGRARVRAWEQANRRYTFHLPIRLVDEVTALAAARADAEHDPPSNSAVVREALDLWVAREKRRRR